MIRTQDGGFLPGSVIGHVAGFQITFIKTTDETKGEIKYMEKQLIQKIRTLAHKECCNYYAGRCVSITIAT